MFNSNIFIKNQYLKRKPFFPNLPWPSNTYFNRYNQHSLHFQIFCDRWCGGIQYHEIDLQCRREVLIITSWFILSTNIDTHSHKKTCKLNIWKGKFNINSLVISKMNKTILAWFNHQAYLSVRGCAPWWSSDPYFRLTVLIALMSLICLNLVIFRVDYCVDWDTGQSSVTYSEPSQEELLSVWTRCLHLFVVA